MLAGKQIVKFARNIDTLGFFVPRLIDEQNRLLCGDARGPASRTVVIAAEKPRIDPLTPRPSYAVGRPGKGAAVCASTGATFTKREAAVHARNNDPAGGGALL